MAPWTRPWNSVDVRGDDGLFRYGRVVDVSDQGLFIDFLCPGRRREFTPFDRVFLNDGKRYLDRDDMAYRNEPYSARPAEVLMRDPASAAWTWYPAKLVVRAGDTLRADYSVAVVQPGNRLEYAHVFPMTRIRWMAGGDYIQSVGLPKCVEKWSFVKRTARLPEGCPLERVTAALKQQKCGLNSLSWFSAQAVGVDIEDGCVVYIQRRSTVKAEPDDMATKRELNHLHRFHDALIDFVAGMPAPLVQTAAVGKPAVLPLELWMEVISNLDTLTQTKLHIVCSTWRIILNSAFVKASVVLDSAAFDQMKDCKDFGRMYFMVCTLFKCLSPSTQHIAVADGGGCMSEMDSLEILNILNVIAQHNAGIRPKTISLFGLKFHLLRSCYGSDSMTPQSFITLFDNASKTFTKSALACRTLPCSSIYLIRSTIALECTVTVGAKNVKLSADIQVDRQRLIGDFGGALWSVLEEGLSGPSDTELERLSSWLTALEAQVDLKFHQKGHKTLVCRTLCATQTEDPRPSLHYRRKNWRVDDLQGLQLEKLSRVALHFLIQLMRSVPH